MGGALKKRRHCASWICLKATASLQQGFVMDLTTQHGPGCKGCEKHVPVLCRGLQMSSLANGNAESVMRSAGVEGDVSPRPSRWSGPITHNQTLHYPHHSPLLPCPTALAARGCWGCLRKGNFGTLKPLSEGLSAPLSHGNDVWKMHYLASITDLSISSSQNCI